MVYALVLLFLLSVCSSPTSSFSSLAAAAAVAASAACSGGAEGGAILVVLGASMVDVGENAEAMPLRSAPEFPPYGLDYFRRPASRFSNGRLIIDFLSQELGYGLLDPFLKSINPNFTHGVNFASSGSTARNSSLVGNGASSSGLFSLDVQIDQYANFKKKVIQAQSKYKGSLTSLPSIVGISNAIHFIETAHNDYITTLLSQSLNIDLPSLVSSVISAMEAGIRELHSLGARTIIVMNVIPLGCTPGFLSFVSGSNATVLDSDGCVASVNTLVNLHNTDLQQLITKLRIELSLPNLVLFDANAIYSDAIRHPSKYGVKYPFESCCGAGGNNNVILSIPCGSKGIVNGQELEAKRCSNPSEYISWDGLHPVESFAKHIAHGVLSGEYLKPQISIKKALCRP